MKYTPRNIFLPMILPALGLAVVLLLIDWFPIYGTLFTTPTSFAVTNGTITESVFISDFSFGSKYHAGYKICREKIVYSYFVRGKNYRSDKINFLPSDAFSCEEAKAYVEKYSEGETVNVFYDPFFPLISVLDPKNKLTFLAYLVSRFFIRYVFVLSILVMWMLINPPSKRKSNRNPAKQHLT